METFVYAGADKKLSKVLCERLPDLSYAYLQKLIRTGDVKINGKRSKEDVTIAKGDEITAYVKEKAVRPELLYEGKQYYIFNKYVGVSSEKFSSYVKNFYPDAVLCHRLDTNTAGLLLFAKSEEYFEVFKKAFYEKRVEKHYYAEVYGDFPESAEYKEYVVKDAAQGKVAVYDKETPGSLVMVTKCRLLRKNGEISCLDVEPVTGRTHQIRAHLAYHGYPIIGDGKYGSETVNRRFRTHVQHLCSYKLIFHTADMTLLADLDGKIFSIPIPSY